MQGLGLVPPSGVGTPMSPADMAREQQLLAAQKPMTTPGDASDIGDVRALVAAAPPAPVAPSAPVAQPAQPARPTQFVSAPQAKPFDPAALLQQVGSISTGSQTSTTRTDLGETGKRAEQAHQVANAAREGAIRADVALGQERGAIKAGEAVARADIATQYEAQLKQQRADEAARALKQSEDIQRSIDDLDREASNISADRWWQEQSTGQKLGNLVAVALSGLGQVFSAKAGKDARNGAMDLIQTQIDRNIDAQKTRLAAKERGIRVKESAYSRAREAGANDIQATEAAYAADYRKLANQTEAKLAGLNDKEQLARGQALVADLREREAAHLDNLAKATAVTSQTQTGSRPVLGLELAQLQGAQQAAEQAAYRKAHGLVEEDPKLQTPLGQAPDAETARDLRGKVVAIEGAENSVKAIRSILKGGGDRLDPQKRKALAFARTQLAQYIKSPAGANLGAALSDSEKQLFLDEQLPDTDFVEQLAGRTETTLKLLDRQFRDTRDSWKKAYTVRTR